MGAGGLGFGIDDFDGANGFDAAAGLLRGGTVAGAVLRRRSARRLSAEFLPAKPKLPWGSDWKKAALKWHDKSSQISFEGGHFPYRQNYMDLDPAYTDKFGDPLIRLTLDWTDHERAQTNMAIRVSSELARRMGAKVGDARGLGPRYSVTYYQSTHVQGGTIVGASRRIKAWSIPGRSTGRCRTFGSRAVRRSRKALRATRR